MKIFISHKQEDENIALLVQHTLVNEGVDAYLDVLDVAIVDDGEMLTKHIRQKLRECTDVIVILSSRTKESWWVPFEIGMATEKDMPIANFLVNTEILPEYLEFWPRLKNQQDVKKYVEVKNKIRQQILLERTYNKGFYHSASEDFSDTQRFYAELKRYL